MIDFMAGEPDAIVETWQPKVGARVLARVGERSDRFAACSCGADATPGEFPRPGRIHSQFSSGRWLVCYDEAWARSCCGLYAARGSFYACELEPLTDNAAHEETNGEA